MKYSWVGAYAHTKIPKSSNSHCDFKISLQFGILAIPFRRRIGPANREWRNLMKQRLRIILAVAMISSGILIDLGHAAPAPPNRITSFSLGSITSKVYPYSQQLSLLYSVSSGASTPRNFTIDSASTASGCNLSNPTSTPTLTATSSGTCVVKLTITTDGANRTATFTFNRADQTLAFIGFPTSAQPGDQIPLKDYVSFNGEPSVTLSVGASTACTLDSSNFVTASLIINKGTGTCRLTVTVASDAAYNSASDYTDVTVSRIDQPEISNPVLSTQSKSFPYSQSPISVTSVTGGAGTGALAITSVANGTATGCSWNGSTLTATSSGTCILTVTKAQDDSYNSTSTTATFTFLSGPVITSITPLTFKSGDVVTINGGNLGSVNSVKFGATSVTPSTVSSTQVKVVAPNTPASGFIKVISSSGDSATSTAQFSITSATTTLSKTTCPTSTTSSGANTLVLTGCQTFQTPAPSTSNPTIDSVAKQSVTSRDTFTITGTNLANPTLVQINTSIKATIVSANATQIVARINTNVTGSYTVSVTVAGKVATKSIP